MDFSFRRVGGGEGVVTKGTCRTARKEATGKRKRREFSPSWQKRGGANERRRPLKDFP